jgi:dienelactone hydrolase
MRVLRLVPALCLAAACSSSAVIATFAVPGGPHASAEFYRLPFPNDLRRGPDGTVDLSGYSDKNPLVTDYINAMDGELDGFGLNAAIVSRFSDAIDPATLPASPEDSLADGASVYLVDVDTASPDYGTRWPLRLRFEARDGQTIGTDWLSALPFPGFPLDEGTTYALVITDRVRDVAGAPVAADDDFLAIAGAGAPSDPALAAARTAYAPLFAWLDQAAPTGERDHVVDAAVFTTQHATAIMPLLRQVVWNLDAPVPAGIAQSTANASYVEYTGTFPSPNFQEGDVPYSVSGGAIILGSDGLPIVQRMEDIRVAITVPPGPTPTGGWPVVIYAHGTGGSYLSFVNNGTAARLAAQGLAAISIDQVLHGPRNPGGNPDVDFFNFQNPDAARNNAVQGAADDFSVVRLVEGFSFVDQDQGTTVTFDPDRIYFFGHSQGGLTGPLFLAYEPEVKGAVLSGAGALLYQALLTKTEPFDIASLVPSLVRDPDVDENDPILAILQTWVERSDPANYGPLLVRHPPDGPDGTPLPPKPIYQSEGFIDHYAPNPTIESFATSIGLDQVEPLKSTIDGLTLRGRTPLTAPVTGNLNGVTAVLLQYDAAANDDGHFVVFDIPAAQLQSARFLGTLADTGTATLVAAP